MKEVKHYFVGTLGIADYYSASLYEQQVLALLDELFLTHDYVLLSGGSMMYIDAVCDGIDDIPTVDDETRETMKRRLKEEGLEALCKELRKLDPEYYASFRKRERRERPFRIIKIGLTLPREELYNRINARVDRMMDEGLLEEARLMYPRRDLNALNTVGYKELFDYFDGRWPLEEAVERIKGNTRRYARKQLTWYKKDDRFHWFHPQDKEEIINYITQYYE